MKTKIVICTIVILVAEFTGSAFGGMEGNKNTFYGSNAGVNTSEDNDYVTFIGADAGQSNTTGMYNTFLGYRTGYSNTTGLNNTFLGYTAGYFNTTGYNNTIIGFLAGEWFIFYFSLLS